jgi:hypothetical protein
MSQENTPQSDLADQFRQLGESLKSFLQGTWESEETQKLRQEVKTGFTELGRAANEAVSEFSQSETGQRLKAEAADFKERLDSGEVETKARAEITKVLSALSTELQKAIDHISETEPTDSEPDA